MRPVLLAAALLLPLPAAAEVVASSDAGFVSRNTVEVGASPMEVWAQFIAPAGWWNSEHTYTGNAANLYLDPQATGCFCEKLPVPAGAPATQRIGSVEHMHIVYAEPGRAMRLRGGLGPLQAEAVEGSLTVTFKTEGGKTRILFEYVVGGYMRQGPTVMAPLVDRVLADQLGRLAAKVSSAAAPAAAAPPAASAPAPAPRPRVTSPPPAAPAPKP